MTVIGATFVAEPIEAPLGLLLGVAGLTAEVRFCPYNQIFGQLLSPVSALAQNADGINVLLVRPEDFVRDQPDTDAARETLAGLATELSTALSEFLQRSRAPTILAVLPVSPAVTPELIGAVEAATQAVTEQLRHIAGLQLLAADDLAPIATTGIHDAVRDRYAHIPYSDEGYAALALVVARRIHALKTLPYKVLVLDCDNTLWRGVVGEDGVDGIVISPQFSALQAYAVELEARGTLICIASKNAEADVLAVLDRRDDMILKARHIATHRINWLPKAANIRAMAEELNLGLDSFVFLDDNPVECAQVRAELPMVVTIQLPGEAHIPSLIRNLWTFDKLVATEEDRNRTRMYRENAARRSLETSAGDIGQFLASLELKIVIDAPGEEEWARVAQLTQRTNQFNLTTQRRSEAQLRAVVADGGYVRRVRVSDRFGDYGLVGVIEAHAQADALVLDNMLLSCRVLGRGVEHAMLRSLGALAAARGLPNVVISLVNTARNEPARAFLDSVIAGFRQDSQGGATYRVPTAVVDSLEHRPGEDPAEVIAASRGDDKKVAAADATSGNEDRSRRYIALATELTTAAAIRLKLQQTKRLTRQVGGEAVRPQSKAERQMLEIWEQTLSITGLGMNDDYFELGGTSLQSVQLFAEIATVFGTELRLTSILDAPTPRRLTALLDAQRDGTARDGVVRLRAGTRGNFFLIHDGLGETLLYRNLALRLPPGIAIYGIEPTALPGIPLPAATMESLAEHYVSMIRRVQPEGPYYLGGMCAGGTIAYAMAHHLSAQLGDKVQLVVNLDGAAPFAKLRRGVRLSRLRQTWAQQRQVAAPLPVRLVRLARTLVRKARNLLFYKLSLIAQQASLRLRTSVLEKVLQSGESWPQTVQPLTVAEIYTYLESRYQPPVLADSIVLLVRATSGRDNDRPFREVYSEEDFGWGQVARRLEIADVHGGHSSMLQEDQVRELADLIAAKLPPVP